MKLSHSPITLGEPVRQLDAGVFVLTEASYASTCVLPRHAHDCATISIVLKGRCIETIGSSGYECIPFSPIMKPAGAIHSNQYGPTGTKCLLIEVRPTGLEMVRSFSRVLDDVVHVPNGAMRGIAIRIHREFQLMDCASALSIEGLILEMVGAATRRRAQGLSVRVPRWIRDVKYVLDENFKEQITLSMLAQCVDRHPAYLSRVFRRCYGSTIGDYMRQLRLDYASKKITHSTESIADIASSVGFYDQSHFTHAFKIHTGVTPAEFRAATRKK
jgi:AraC family transcriptional regulator